MPELPEVETVARDLRRHVLDATIAGSRTLWPRTLRSLSGEAFDAAVRGRTIEDVGRRGKQIVVTLSGGAALTIHLKMTGQLFVVTSGAPVDPYVRLVLSLGDGRELRFRDIRKFGRVGFYLHDQATGELREPGVGRAAFADLGPEPLDPTFTLGAFRSRLRSRRGRLKPLLVDQAFLAGIGNIYADEALWASGLHPLRRVSSLRPWHERCLFGAVRAVLAEAVERRGSSIDDYTAPDGDGAMQERLAVYGRTGEPCLRCGRPVRRIVIGARSTHFCSWCQRLPAADRHAAQAILSAAHHEGRGGPLWTDGPVGTLGLTRVEAAAAAVRARAERTRRAAATRRARARAAVDGSGSGRGSAPTSTGQD